jgi:hypothetical protein
VSKQFKEFLCGGSSVNRWQFNVHHHCTLYVANPYPVTTSFFLRVRYALDAELKPSEIAIRDNCSDSNTQPQSWCPGARTSHHKCLQRTARLTIGTQHPIGPYLLWAYAPSPNHRLLPQSASTKQRTTYTRIARSISCSEPHLRQRCRIVPLYTPILDTHQYLL